MEAGGLSTSSLTTGQVRGRRSGTEHADLPVITGRLFLGLPVGVRAESHRVTLSGVKLSGV